MVDCCIVIWETIAGLDRDLISILGGRALGPRSASQADQSMPHLCHKLFTCTVRSIAYFKGDN
jgi:hypothetical protein